MVISALARAFWAPSSEITSKLRPSEIVALNFALIGDNASQILSDRCSLRARGLADSYRDAISKHEFSSRWLRISMRLDIPGRQIGS